MTCCFVGHRDIYETEELRKQLYRVVEDLIVNKSVDTFLFGSKSRFNSLCYELVTDLKEKYPKIKRVYVRAEFPVIHEDYKRYLLTHYEDTYYPESVVATGKAVYINRNKEMIDRSNFCVFYYNEKNLPIGRKSGTKIALDYGEKCKKVIYQFPHIDKEKTAL